VAAQAYGLAKWMPAGVPQLKHPGMSGDSWLPPEYVPLLTGPRTGVALPGCCAAVINDCEPLQLMSIGCPRECFAKPPTTNLSDWWA
jgi:hypothetical protein